MAPRKVVEDLSRQTLFANDTSQNSNGKDSVGEYDLSSFSPELQQKFRKHIEAYKPVKLFGRQIFQAPIVWRNVILISYIHLMGLYGFTRAPHATWTTWWWTYILWAVIGGLGVTAGAHRLWTHRTYKAHWTLRTLMMFFNCISFQNDILEWSRDHRVHHKFSETDADPHNAKRGFFFAHVGWLLMKKHPLVLIKGRNVDMSDLHKDPVVAFQRKHYFLLSFIWSIFLPVVVPVYLSGDWWWNPFCLSFSRYVVILNATWLVNSAAHLWGNKPYDGDINPSENLFVSFGAIGEGFHNFHHTFPFDYSTSEYGPYVNMTTIFIDFCASLGLVWDRKKVSLEAVVNRKKRTGNLKETTNEYLPPLAPEEDFSHDY